MHIKHELWGNNLTKVFSHFNSVMLEKKIVTV